MSRWTTKAANAAGSRQTAAPMGQSRAPVWAPALTIVAEAGDLGRFRTAPQFMAYAGAVQSESSSGSWQQRGSITRTGSSLLRHPRRGGSPCAPRPRLWLARWQAAPGEPTTRDRCGGLARATAAACPLSVSQLAHCAPKALTAVARELAGFIWA
jgi:hypothetical protein